MKPRPGRRPFLSILLAPVVLAAAVGAYFAFEGGGNAAAVADESANPCVDGAEVEQAAFLVDLRKPIDPAHASLPGALLKNAAGEMQPGTHGGCRRRCSDARRAAAAHPGAGPRPGPSSRTA